MYSYDIVELFSSKIRSKDIRRELDIEHNRSEAYQQNCTNHLPGIGDYRNWKAVLNCNSEEVRVDDTGSVKPEQLGKNIGRTQNFTIAQSLITSVSSLWKKISIVFGIEKRSFDTRKQWEKIRIELQLNEIEKK